MSRSIGSFVQAHASPWEITMSSRAFSQGIPTTDHDFRVPVSLHSDAFATRLAAYVLGRTVREVFDLSAVNSTPRTRAFGCLLTAEMQPGEGIHLEFWCAHDDIVRRFHVVCEELEGWSWDSNRHLELYSPRNLSVAALGTMVPYHVSMHPSGFSVRTVLGATQSMRLPLQTSEILRALGLARHREGIDLQAGRIPDVSRADREVLEQIAAMRKDGSGGELLMKLRVDRSNPERWHLPSRSDDR
jgi:hypothetical protein